MKQVVIIRGPLGIGKTTISKKISDKFNGVYYSMDEILSKYKLDKIKVGKNIPAENFIRANEIILPLIEKNLENNQMAVIDGNFYHKEQIEHLERSLSTAPIIFTLKAPVEICIKRDAARERPYGVNATRAVHKMVSEFDYGTAINTENQTINQTLKEILSTLRL